MTDTDKINGIRFLAEDYVKAYHPDESGYFSLAWDTIASRRSAPAPFSVPRGKWLDKFTLKFHGSGSAQLPVAAISLATFSIIDELQRNSWRVTADTFIPMIRACAKAAGMPRKEALHFEEYMAPRIQQQYARFTATAEEVICAGIIDDENGEAVWIWRGDKDTSNHAKQRYSQAEIDAKFRNNKDKYDLFLDNGCMSAKINGKHESIPFKSHSYYIVFLLLIRRGKRLTNEEIYRRVWVEEIGPGEYSATTSSGDIKSDAVKVYVKRIRDRLSFLPGFRLDVDKGLGGTSLSGAFSFCAILPVKDAARFLTPLA